MRWTWDIYRPFHPKTAKYTFFFKCTWKILQNTLGLKTSLNKFKMTEIISSIFSNHNAMKLEINYRKKTQKNRHEEDKQHSTKQPVGQRGNKQEIKNYLETKENENITFQNSWDAAFKSSSKGEVHTYTGLPQEKSQINTLFLHLKKLEQQTKLKAKIPPLSNPVIGTHLSPVHAPLSTSLTKWHQQFPRHWYGKGLQIYISSPGLSCQPETGITNCQSYISMYLKRNS